MTRKDFIAIAEAIRNNITDPAQRQVMAMALVPALRASNERFNERRFVDTAVGR